MLYFVYISLRWFPSLFHFYNFHLSFTTTIFHFPFTSMISIFLSVLRFPSFFSVSWFPFLFHFRDFHFLFTSIISISLSLPRFLFLIHFHDFHLTIPGFPSFKFLRKCWWFSRQFDHFVLLAQSYRGRGLYDHTFYLLYILCSIPCVTHLLIFKLP